MATLIISTLLLTILLFGFIKCEDSSTSNSQKTIHEVMLQLEKLNRKVNLQDSRIEFLEQSLLKQNDITFQESKHHKKQLLELKNRINQQDLTFQQFKTFLGANYYAKLFEFYARNLKNCSPSENVHPKPKAHEPMKFLEDTEDSIPPKSRRLASPTALVSTQPNNTQNSNDNLELQIRDINQHLAHHSGEIHQLQQALAAENSSNHQVSQRLQSVELKNLLLTNRLDNETVKLNYQGSLIQNLEHDLSQQKQDIYYIKTLGKFVIF